MKKVVEILEKNGVKYQRCTECGELKVLSEDNFHKDKHKSSGFKSKCKMCVKDNYLANREDRIAYQLRYIEKNKDCIALQTKVKAKGMKLPRKEALRILALNNGVVTTSM